MRPQDIYNRNFDAATTELDRWLETMRDVAAIDREQTQSYWRTRLTPNETNACPIELMLSRKQTFDIELGPGTFAESLSDQAITDLGQFLPIFEGVAAGNAELRRWRVASTGREVAREVVVRLAGGRTWSIRRSLANRGSGGPEPPTVADARAFLPYRRG
jgi:hypothetical protein